MLKKTFILTQFGTPHSWTKEYFENVAALKDTGWHWLIFTPHEYQDLPENVTVVKMTIEEFSDLCQEKIGVNPKNHILPNGVPSKHMSDFYIASGKIFEDYLKDVDYWGITNWDIAYGRLSHFIPDELLKACDIFSDDINTINGIFTLFKNQEEVNVLFKEIPNWEELFTTHQLYGTDEYHMTDVVRKNSDKVQFFSPMYYPLHSHDRLEQHVPQVKLSMKEDGSLWELSKDVNGPNWEHARPFIGREIPYFHFIRTKAWPNMQ